MNMKKCFKQTAALAAMFLAGLGAAPGAWAQYGDGGNIYVRVYSFDSEIKEVTNGFVLLNSSSAIETFFNNLDNRYVLSTKPGTLLYRAVQTGLSQLKADEMRLPEDIVAVNLITFTDGIDQGSTTPGLPAVPGFLNGDSLARMTPEQSRDYLKRQFNALRVRGKPITGYSIGLMGTDVDPANQHLFTDNLNAFNSEEKKFQGERQSISQIRENFREIGGRLYEQTRNSIMILEIPAPNPGTRVRWTFDIARNNNSSAAAAGSRRYIEGDFDYEANDIPVLKNIRYGGDIQSRENPSGTSVRGKLDGMMVRFEFSQFSGANDADVVREWLQISGSNAWQANVEFVKDATEIRQERHLSTVIYMVLDSSMSMGRENIDLFKDSVAAALEPFGIKRGSPPPRRRETSRETPRTSSDDLSNYVFVDTAPLLAGLLGLESLYKGTINGYGIGLGYERTFLYPFPFSIAAYFDVISISGDSELFAWDILIRPRWYPLHSSVGKWYLGAMLGYGTLEEEYQSFFDYKYRYGSGFVVGVETGYKFVFGHLGLEPWLGYRYTIAGGYSSFKFGVTLGYVW